MEVRAAVAHKAGAPLSIETVQLEGPKTGEVMVEIKATGICHTDEFTLSGADPEGIFPSILGHEGAGVVVEVGPEVRSVKKGDHVIPLYTPECRQCEYCLSGKTNLCQAIRATQGQGLMPDGTSRFRQNGTTIYHYMGTSTFANYTVLPEIAVAKIREDAPFDKVCYIGCGVTTGIGAVINTAKVEPGANVVVFGLGGIGLNVIQGARLVGADMIVGVDLNPSKVELAKKFGMTHFVNPKEVEGDLVPYLVDLTKGGADYTFECIGNVKTMRQALECCHKGWGESTIIGVAPAGAEISTRPFQLVTGRVWRGTAFGGAKGRTDVPKIVDWYMEGKINIDDLITHTMPLDKINDGFDLMHARQVDPQRRDLLIQHPCETCRQNRPNSKGRAWTELEASVVSHKWLYDMRVLEGSAGAQDLGEDVLALGVPEIALGGEIVLGEVGLDGADELTHAGEAALAHDRLGEIAKEALDEVQPRARGRGEVQDDAVAAVRPAVAGVAPGDPALHLGMLVGGVVVDDQMQGEVARRVLVELLEEPQPVLVSVAWRGLAEDLAVEIGQRREQGDGAVAGIVVGAGAHVADAERQAGLRALQRLALALLVAAQDQRLVGRLEVEADHVPELGLELRVVRQLEGPGEMRLDRVGGPQPLHRRLRHACGLGHRAHRPAGPSRRRLRRPADDRALGLERHARLAPAARGIGQAAEAGGAKAPLPQHHHRPVDPHAPRRLGLAQAVGAVQDDLAPAHRALGCRRPLHQPLQRLALRRGDRQSLDRTRHASSIHHPPPSV